MRGDSYWLQPFIWAYGGGLVDVDAKQDLLTAAAVLIMIPALGFFYWAQRYLVTGLTAGGTKY